jgi:hypothetical protein
VSTDYQGNTGPLVAVGNAVYQALRTFSQGHTISPLDLERPLVAALQVSAVFKMVCATKRHAQPALYAVFALALARYLIDYEWHNITRP